MSLKEPMTPEALLGHHYQTALLESLDWDDEKLSDLINHVIEYLNDPGRSQISKDDISILLASVEDNWGFDSKEVLESIFNIESFYLNLNAQRSQDVN